MSKQRGNNRIRRGYTPKRPVKQEGFWHKSRRSMVWFWSLVSLLFVVIGWYTNWHKIQPTVRIESGAPLNPQQPFSAPIKLTNETLYALSDVKMSCQIANAKTLSGNTFNNLVGGHDSGNIGVLQRNETHQVACPIFWQGADTSYLDVDVILDFNGYWGMIPMQVKKRLLAAKDNEGKFQWLEKSESSRRPNTSDRPTQLQP